MLMTSSTVALLDRAVQERLGREIPSKWLVATETEGRPFDFQVSAADQAVLAMTTGAVTALDRLVHHPFCVEGSILLVAIKAGLATFCRRSPGGA